MKVSIYFFRYGNVHLLILFNTIAMTELTWTSSYKYLLSTFHVTQWAQPYRFLWMENLFQPRITIQKEIAAKCVIFPGFGLFSQFKEVIETRSAPRVSFPCQTLLIFHRCFYCFPNNNGEESYSCPANIMISHFLFINR